MLISDWSSDVCSSDLKVIQVPMRVPQVNAEDVRAYIYSLFVAESASAQLPLVQSHLMDALQGSWDGKTFTRDEVDKLAGSPDGLRDKLAVADRLAPILTRSEEGGVGNDGGRTG